MVRSAEKTAAQRLTAWPANGRRIRDRDSERIIADRRDQQVSGIRRTASASGSKRTTAMVENSTPADIGSELRDDLTTFGGAPLPMFERCFKMTTLWWRVMFQDDHTELRRKRFNMTTVPHEYSFFDKRR
jgi:hypothetical protein